MGIAVFLLSFAFYLFNLAPSITVGDAGELIASCYILGINHAPGYPLFSLFGKIFISLLHLGDIAYRVNALSAVFGAATVAVLFSLLKTYSGPLKAAASSLILAASFSFVRSSIQTEVFTLNSFFAALIIYLSLIPAEEKIGFLRWYLISFLFGIGLGNHHTLILLAPAVIYLFFSNKSLRYSLSAAKILSLFCMFMIGFSVYLYLPIRSLKDPGFDVGNPDNPSRMLRVIRRADYGTLKLTVGEKQSYNVSVIARQFMRIFEGIAHQFTFFGVLLIIAGIYRLFKKNLRIAAFLALLYIFSIPFFIFLGNMPFNAEAEGILDRFYVLGNIPLVFFIYFGAESITDRVKFRGGSLLIFSSLIILILFFNYRHYNWRNYFLSYDYGKNLLKSIEPGAAFFMDGGDDTFYSMGYFVYAKKIRRDISLFDRGGVVFKTAYGSDFRKLNKDEKERRRKAVESKLYSQRPIAFSTFNKEIFSPARVEAIGILYAPSEKKNLFHFYSFRNLFTTFGDYRSHALQPLYFYLESQFSPAPVDLLAYCASRWPDVLWLKSNVRIELTNIAYRYFSDGMLSDSRRIYGKIVEKYPDDTYSLVNLGVIAEKEGRDAEALQFYKQAMNVDPSYAMAYYNAAVLHWKKSERGNVIYHFGKVLELDPKNEQAMKYLQIARQKIQGK